MNALLWRVRVTGPTLALLVWRDVGINAALIACLDRYRMLVRADVGFDHIDLAAAGTAGIPVCNTRDHGTSKVADHAIGMLLALQRGLIPNNEKFTADPVGSFVPAIRLAN